MVPVEPLIDSRDYTALGKLLLGRIPIHNPEWTDFNESDPGITLVELFAFLADTLLWQLDERKRQRRRRRRLAFLAVGAVGIGLLSWTRSAGRGSSPGWTRTNNPPVNRASGRGPLMD